MENRAHALIAGAFVIVLGLAVAAVSWWFGGTRTQTRDLLLVTQRNVNGLNPLAQVRYRGMSAGKVVSITLDPEDRRNIHVRVRVDAALPLTRSTTAQLNSQGITGLAYVQLEDTGESSEMLPVSAESPPRILLQSTLMESLGDRAGDVVAQIDTVAKNLNRVLDERNLRHLNQTMENMAVASDGLREIPQLLASVKVILSPGNIQRLQAILAHLERTAGETTPLVVETRAMVTSLQAMSQRFDALGARLGSDLSEESLPRINGLIADLQRNSRQMQRVLELLEAAPQSVVFGPPADVPGPGEPGFVLPEKKME
jgi:phospholipid/cholesterol/gamma-HCH transport system substrate-binding protein